MLTMLLTHLQTLMTDRVHRIRSRPDDGYTSETIVITAILVVLGLTVGGIITAKVISRAEGISLE